MADEKKTALRVLRDHEEHKANDVISLGADAAAGAVAEGWADDNAAAVAYARSIAKPAETAE